MRQPVTLKRTTGADRVAVVSLTAATAPGQWLVQVARGPKRSSLTSGTTYGPYPESQAQAAFDEAVAQLLGEGFEAGGAAADIAALSQASPRRRAIDALRLARAGHRELTPKLLELLPAAVDETCSLLDAIGLLGDARGREALEDWAQRRLLSRRRSALEGLRRLPGDAPEAATKWAWEAAKGLPDGLVKVLDGDLNDPARADALVSATLATNAKFWGVLCDSFYELGLPATVAAARRLVAERLEFSRAFHWRYVKSIFKRARLRRDDKTFGELAVLIERRGRQLPAGKAVVKSGYDGAKRHTTIFHKRTRQYLRRLAWRHLRELARSHPEEYPRAAAAMLAAYGPEDGVDPKGRVGRFGHAYMLNRILFGSSSRLQLQPLSLVHRFRSAKDVDPPASKAREELPYSELWDRHPEAWAALLAASRLELVHRVALSACRGKEAQVSAAATAQQLLGMLGAPYAPTVNLGVSELDRRFDPKAPDLELLKSALEHSVEVVRRKGLSWLQATAPVWTASAALLLELLQLQDGEARAIVIEAGARAAAASPALRGELAPQVWALLQAPEAFEGAHDGVARLASEALVSEINGLCDLDEALALLESGSMAAKALAGALIGGRPGALESLGLARVTSLAQSELVAARRAGLSLIKGALPSLRDDPSALLILVESEWPDTREVALQLLRDEVDIARLGFDGIFGLLDSNREDVQVLGQALLLEHIEEFEPEVVLGRLAEHPRRSMQGFVLELITRVEALLGPRTRLEAIAPFLRQVLMDLRPRRARKRAALALLSRRGLASEEDARVALALLSEQLPTSVVQDRELILGVALELQLAWPALQGPLALQGAG